MFEFVNSLFLVFNRKKQNRQPYSLLPIFTQFSIQVTLINYKHNNTVLG